MALGLTPRQIIEKGTHTLLQINENWSRVILEDIAIVQNGYAFSSKYFNHSDGIPLIRIRDINSPETENLYSGEYSEDYLVSKGDILIGMDGDFKASKWPGEQGLLNQRVCRVFFDSEFYDKGFFFICLQPYLDAIHQETSAVTVKHLSSKTIKKIPLPLPPLPEQRAIVAKLEQLFSELDHGIASLRTARAQLGVYRQAVLRAAFAGELTGAWREKRQEDLPNGEEFLKEIEEERNQFYEDQIKEWEEEVRIWASNGKRNKRPRKPKKQKIKESNSSGLHELPTEWSWHPLLSLCKTISDGPFGSNLKTSDYVESGVRVIRLENIGNLEFKDEKKTFVSSEKYKTIRNHTVYPEDIIFGSFISDNTSVARVPKHIAFAINKADCFCVRPVRTEMSKYLEYFLSSKGTYNQLVKQVHGATRPRINTTQLKEVSIPVCSFAEQQEIVQEIESRLSVCDHLEQTIDQSLDQAEALRQSLLKKAFAGELLTEEELAACRAEADWVPAGELLAQIKK